MFFLKLFSALFNIPFRLEGDIKFHSLFFSELVVFIKPIDVWKIFKIFILRDPLKPLWNSSVYEGLIFAAAFPALQCRVSFRGQGGGEL